MWLELIYRCREFCPLAKATSFSFIWTAQNIWGAHKQIWHAHRITAQTAIFGDYSSPRSVYTDVKRGHFKLSSTQQKRFAVFPKESTTASCEINLFSCKPTKSYRFLTLSESLTWLQTHHKSQWIYICHSQRLRSIRSVVLNDSGIRFVQPNCTLKTSEITTRWYYDASSSIQILYLCFDSIKQLTNINESSNTLNSTRQIQTSYSEKLNELQTQRHEADSYMKPTRLSLCQPCR